MAPYRNDAGHEPVRQLVSEPGDVSGIHSFGSGRGFHVTGDDPPVRSLGNQVDLVTPMVIAKMERRRPDLRDFSLWAKLGKDERLDEPAQEVPVPHDGLIVDAEQRDEE